MSMQELLEILEDRFNKHMYRHQNSNWEEIKELISSSKEKMDAISIMEETGGEPDLVCLNGGDRLLYVDMSKETPDRRSFCYDELARTSRKKNAPESSALEFCQEHNLNLLNEEEYISIQKLDDLDLKTSSWILTPKGLRDQGGALFGDKRYGRCFIYHNGADSYYGARSFRTYIDLKS